MARAGNDVVIVLPVDHVTLYGNGSTDDKVKHCNDLLLLQFLCFNVQIIIHVCVHVVGYRKIPKISPSVYKPLQNISLSKR